MNPLIDRRALAPVCAAFTLLLCTSNLSCSSNPCAPVFHAIENLRGKTFHSFVSGERSDSTESEATSNEGIQVDGTAYWKDHGKWAIIGSSDREFSSEQAKAASNISCRLEDAEFIDGESADHYITHGAWQDDVDVRGQFWVSKSTGLILRANYKFNAAGLASGNQSFRYEYTNFTAPIISK